MNPRPDAFAGQSGEEVHAFLLNSRVPGPAIRVDDHGRNPVEGVRTGRPTVGGHEGLHSGHPLERALDQQHARPEFVVSRPMAHLARHQQDLRGSRGGNRSGHSHQHRHRDEQETKGLHGRLDRTMRRWARDGNAAVESPEAPTCRSWPAIPPSQGTDHDSLSTPMKTLLATALTAIALTLSSHAADWLTNFEAARNLATKEKKLILLDFTGSDWCGWCVKMKKEVFDMPAFKEYAKKNLVLVEVDFPRRKRLPATLAKQNESLMQKYDVAGFPTYVILDSDGKEIGRQPEYLKGGPSAFIDKIEGIKAKVKAKAK
jgi:thioredoxin-related protein